MNNSCYWTLKYNPYQTYRRRIIDDNLPLLTCLKMIGACSDANAPIKHHLWPLLARGSAAFLDDQPSRPTLGTPQANQLRQKSFLPNFKDENMRGGKRHFYSRQFQRGHFGYYYIIVLDALVQVYLDPALATGRAVQCCRWISTTLRA